MNQCAIIIFSVVLLFGITDVNTVIIPDDLPGVMSLIYSYIPTIMKGTDSRIGWGFRFGDRADLQVLMEFGPQIKTQPLANQPEMNNRKRNVISDIQRRQAKRNEFLDLNRRTWLSMLNRNGERKEPNNDLNKKTSKLQSTLN